MGLELTINLDLTIFSRETKRIVKSRSYCILKICNNELNRNELLFRRTFHLSSEKNERKYVFHLSPTFPLLGRARLLLLQLRLQESCLILSILRSILS